MAEAILPGSVTGGSSGSGPWEHIGTYSNTNSQMRVSGPSSSTLLNYIVVTMRVTNSFTFQFGTSVFLYIYNNYYTMDSAAQIKSGSIFAFYRIHSRSFSDNYPNLWILYCARDNYPHTVALSGGYAFAMNADSSNPLTGAANALTIDMYGIRSPYA